MRNLFKILREGSCQVKRITKKESNKKSSIMLTRERVMVVLDDLLCATELTRIAMQRVQQRTIQSRKRIRRLIECQMYQPYAYWHQSNPNLCTRIVASNKGW